MARPIMIQGTMSNAGKSLLAAGLCRIFHQDGYRTAPFKSQNMALNSYITADGLEMGRAQAVQAEAAGILPETAMNPILLKPTSHTGSQVIVNGRVLGNYPASQYYKMKGQLIPHVLQAYESLASRFDIIVIEGAGSPAEINLRENDFVNMGLAKMVDAPVLLAGDIDRGGVFAQLYGTAALLPKEERQRIRGFIINKFRGDKELLRPGLSMLYERIPIPVAGVVPYMDIDLDDEDSLADRLSSTGKDCLDSNGNHAFAKIAVLRLPRISNFTDFHVLERLPGIALRYVSRPEELLDADLILIPGTKNTMGDLKWMRENGLEAAVLRKAGQIPVMGICGGYQMLGETLTDPDGVEEGGEMRGMGLLPVSTRFSRKKTRSRVMGAAEVFGRPPVYGYEIHMGETVRTGGQAFCRIRPEFPALHEDQEFQTAGFKGNCLGENGLGASDFREDGCVKGLVFGTYLHGVFDSEEMQEALWNALARKKGILDQKEQWTAGAGPSFSLKEYKETQYEKLAQVLRENLDMEMIYRILERKDG